jgi:hypothetical protein
MYIGSICDKRGRKLFQGTPEESHERAAMVCFRDYRGKPPKHVSVCRAYRDPAGNWQGNGSDTRWYRCDEVWRDPPTPADHGLFSDEAKQVDLADLL